MKKPKQRTFLPVQSISSVMAFFACTSEESRGSRDIYRGRRGEISSSYEMLGWQEVLPRVGDDTFSPPLAPQTQHVINVLCSMR